MTTDVQPYDGAAVQNPATAPQTAPGAPQGLFGPMSPAQLVAYTTEAAEALSAVLEEDPAKNRKPLYKVIRDRKHVFVEGWTLLGAMVHVFAVTVWSRRITDHEGVWQPPTLGTENRTLHSKWCDNGSQNSKGEASHPQTEGCKTYSKEVTVVVAPGRGGWEARVEARYQDQTIGAAEAECRWDEATWADRDSFALRSMAQTRATSRALRQPLGFIVELAGFSATAAEEMTQASLETGDEPAADQPKCPSCSSALWDNRQDDKPGMPAFRCKNRSCTGGTADKNGKPRPWATFDPHFFDPPKDYTNRAKAKVMEAIASDLNGWVDRYSGEQPLDADTPWPPEPADMAARVWVELASLERMPKPTSPENADLYGTAATQLLLRHDVEGDAVVLDVIVERDRDADERWADGYGS